MAAKKVPLNWGNTSLVNELTVYVAGVHPSDNVEDIVRAFGGDSQVSGVVKFPYYALVQFKATDKAATAIRQGHQHLNHRTVVVKSYERKKNNVLKTNLQANQDAASVGRVSRLISRASSAHGSCSSFTTALSPISLAGSSNSKAGDSYKAFRQPSQLRSSNGPEENSSVSDQLPQDIRLILELILTQGTARKQSLLNIQQLIEYLESEKKAIGELNKQVDIRSASQSRQNKESRKRANPNTETDARELSAGFRGPSSNGSSLNHPKLRALLDILHGQEQNRQELDALDNIYDLWF